MEHEPDSAAEHGSGATLGQLQSSVMGNRVLATGTKLCESPMDL